MTQIQEKTLQFYNKARKQYEANRPLNYEFSLTKEDPKSKKFRILLNKFVEIFGEGMHDQYKFDVQDSNNFWQELQKHFVDFMEMKYIINKIYQSKQVKIRLFFMLLLNNKKLFDFLYETIHRIPHLYKSPQQKRRNLQKQLEVVNFFKDGQFTITTSNNNYIADFKAFWEAEEAKLLFLQKQVRQLVTELVEEIQKRENQRRDLLLKEQEEKAKLNKLKEQEKKQKYTPKPTLKKEQKIQPTGQSLTPNINLQDSPLAFEAKTEEPWKQITPEGPYTWDKKPRGMKNSEFLYNKRFKDELQLFENNGHPFNYEFSISEDKFECAQCKKPLSRGFLIFGNDTNFCNDTGKWFCSQDMASQRIQVPHKAKNEFDLKGYSVSRRSYEIIKLYFQMPIIELRHDEKVVFEHKILYDFLVLKRQLHLMYDSICNTQYMEKTFTKRINYCLKKNLFSLKNLYDIYNGHQTPQIQKDFGILQRHFYKCEICQTRKGRLCHMCNNPPKIFSFELRDTYSCKHCKNIYHRRCLNNTICPCERQ